MNVPETLEQYLIQFLNENKNKNYPDNYNDIADAAQIITEHYFPQQEDFDAKDSYIAELEDDCDNMSYCGQDIVDDVRTDMENLEDELDVLCADSIPESIKNIIKDVEKICDRWCY